MLLLLGENNCIRGITYKVLWNMKLKWSHTECTSPSELRHFPLHCLLSPFCCKVHIEVWQETLDNWHMLDLISSESSHGPWLKSDCHFYNIYSSPSLIAFLSEEIFSANRLRSRRTSLSTFQKRRIFFNIYAFYPTGQQPIPDFLQPLSAATLRARFSLFKASWQKLLWCHLICLKDTPHRLHPTPNQCYYL